MKSKDLIAMGIIVAAALSINGMTASADEVSADTSYEALAPSYSDSRSSGSPSSSSGTSGSNSSTSSSSSSSGSSSGSAGSNSSSSSSGSAGSSIANSSSGSVDSGSASLSSGSASLSSGSAGSSSSSSSSGSADFSSSGASSGSSGSDAGFSSGSAGHDSASDSSGTGVSDSDLSGTGNSDSESGSSDSNSAVSTFGSGSDSSNTDSASSDAADSGTSGADASNSNLDKTGNSSDEEIHEDRDSTDSEATGHGETMSGISGGSDVDPSAAGSSGTASGNASDADLLAGNISDVDPLSGNASDTDPLSWNTSDADLLAGETITETRNIPLMDENGTDEHTDEETSALSDARMPENTSDSLLSLTLGDSLFTTEAKLTEADSNILMESAGDTEEIQPDPAEPDRGTVYKSSNGYGSDIYFAYDEETDSWEYSYNEKDFTNATAIKNFKIVSEEGVYSYDVVYQDGTTDSYMSGVKEDTDKVTKTGDFWYVYDGSVYFYGRRVDSVLIDADKEIYTVDCSKAWGRTSIYYEYNDLSCNALLGWQADDVKWLTDSDDTEKLFMYQDNLYSMYESESIAYPLKIQKRSEDNSIIWFMADKVENYDPGQYRYWFIESIVGWEDKDITWIDKGKTIFRLNKTGDYYLLKDSCGVADSEKIAVRIENAQLSRQNNITYRYVYLFTEDGDIQNIEKIENEETVYRGDDVSYEDCYEGSDIHHITIRDTTYRIPQLMYFYYTASIDKSVYYNIGNDWYLPRDYDHRLVKVPSEKITDTIFKVKSIYLTGIPEEASWVALSEDGKTGVFQYEDAAYLAEGDYAPAEVQLSRNEDGTITVGDGEYLLNWSDVVTVSPDGTFFYDNKWYHSDDGIIAHADGSMYSFYHADLLGYSMTEEEARAAMEKTEYIGYDDEKGCLLKYGDGSISPVSGVYAIGNLTNVIGVTADGYDHIIGYRDKSFLSLCDKLYYGKNGLEKFEYDGAVYAVLTDDIAGKNDRENDSESDDYLYQKEGISGFTVDDQNDVVVVDYYDGDSETFSIDHSKSTDKYLAYKRNSDSDNVFIFNWSMEDVEYVTEFGADWETNANYSRGYLLTVDTDFYLKGYYPYEKGILFKLNDGNWYVISGSYDIERDSFEGFPAEGLDVITENGLNYVEDNGVLTVYSAEADQGRDVETVYNFWEENNGLIIGINNVNSGIDYYQTSDFKYYDITGTGAYRKVPALLHYKDQDYVTYDGCTALPVHLIDSENEVFEGYIQSKWLYSNWMDNQAATWLTRIDDGEGRSAGWFIYNGNYYYTSDGRSAKKYVLLLSDGLYVDGKKLSYDSFNMWSDSNINYRIEIIRQFTQINYVPDYVDTADEDYDDYIVNKGVNNYYSSKAVTYAEEHVSDTSGTADDDCANYVSQCLSAGGLAYTNNWHPGTYAWNKVGEQMKFLEKFGEPSIVDRNHPEIGIGDPVYYDFYGDGKYDHVAICTGINKETGKPIVYDHSSKKLIKDFDELEADVIATISLPDKDDLDKNSELMMLAEDFFYEDGSYADPGHPKIYIINWNSSAVDYYLLNDRQQKNDSKKGIFVYDGNWYMSLDGQTAALFEDVETDDIKNWVQKSMPLLEYTGEKNLYFTDSYDSDKLVEVYIEDDLDEEISNLDGKSYYYDPSDGTWKDLALRYDIGVSIFDSDQISSIIIINRKDEAGQKKAYLSFDGAYASPATSFELKSDTNSFTRFDVEKDGRQTVYITDWNPAGADFDLYIDNGGKETSYYRYSKSAGKQLRVGYFAYDNKWYFTGDGQTAVYKHECYYGGKLVLPGEGERGFQRSGSGDWIYVGPDGEKVRNQIVTQGNKKFYLNSDGVLLQSGRVQIGGVWYYADENGVIQTEKRSDTVAAADKGVQPENVNKKTTGGSAAVPAATDLSAVIHAGSGEIKEGNILLPLLMRGSRFSGRTVQVNAALLNGWVEDNHNRYYYRTGVMQHGWLMYDHNRYYLDLTTGIMQTGWRNIEDDWYFFDDNGKMHFGWLSKDGNRYYLDEVSGARHTGFTEIDGQMYFFNEDGVMQTGWVEIDGEWYYFDENGVMQVGWAEIDEKWYYFDEDGVMQTRWLTLDDKTYYLGTDGVRVSGSQTIDGEEYEFDEDGVLTSGEAE